MTPLRVFYRTGSARTQMILVLVAALLSAGLTLGAAGALMGLAGGVWTIALPLLAPLSWWAVFAFHRAAKARGAAIEAGTPAILADADGFSYLDEQGRSRRLDWAQIHGFHIAGTDQGELLRVAGSYPHAGLRPVDFAVAELDADAAQLVRDLERLRAAAAR